MGVTSREKEEFTGYQMKGVAQVWHIQWKEKRSERAGPIDWDIFQKAFLDKYFPHEKREAKVEEFINLRQGSMGVEEYSIKFNE